ncbi:MAG: hypothetical protein A2068_09670 [Ignavibacteria bacterium GWB2_35_6b]|nr:MAG: hypothetical protein A2068_09670 [Ignavibacteria bacterium GWB2_35_6b]
MHVDLYRIDNEYEFLEIGLDNYLEDSITFIEWGDKFQEYFADFMKIKFEFVDDSENCRKLKLTIKGNKWIEKFTAIENNLNKRKIL